MTPDQIKADYRAALDRVGTPAEVIIRRYTGAGTNRPRFDTPVRGRVVGYSPNDLVGSIVQGDRKIIILAEDLIAAQFPLPVLTSDKAVVRGKELAIMAADDSTRRVQGVLIAVELQVRG